MKRILTIFGTRPEAIKLAPVVDALGRRSGIDSIVCATGQHDEMLKQVLDLFEIRPQFDLRVMRPDQTLADLTSSLLTSLDRVVRDTSPAWIVAQGDTTTAFVSALVAYYRRIPFAHVEAGLRTGDKLQPFPEEINRRLADALTDLYFAPTPRAEANLLSENYPRDSIMLTGNTVVDALMSVAERPFAWSGGSLATLDATARIVLVTAHRRESFGGGLEQVCLAIKSIAERFEREKVSVVFPVHLNPNVQRPVHGILAGMTNVHLLPPLDYLTLVHLLKRAEIVLTDSGGIQEEAPTFKVPVLVMRATTERPEGVEAGIARLVGTSHDEIVRHATELLTSDAARHAMSMAENPYGDGHAARRIADALVARG